MIGREFFREKHEVYQQVHTEGLAEYNRVIVSPQEQMYRSLPWDASAYLSGAFITVTSPYANTYPYFERLMKHLNDGIFSDSKQKQGEGMRGLGVLERQVAHGLHYHAVLKPEPAFGERLERLKKILRWKSSRLRDEAGRQVFMYHLGIQVQQIDLPRSFSATCSKIPTCGRWKTCFSFQVHVFSGCRKRRYLTTTG